MAAMDMLQKDAVVQTPIVESPKVKRNSPVEKDPWHNWHMS